MKTLKKSHAVTVNRLQNNYIIPLRQKKVFIFIEKNKNNIEKKHDDEKKCKQKKTLREIEPELNDMMSGRDINLKRKLASLRV